LVYLFTDWENMEVYGTEQLQIIQVLTAEEEKTVISVVAGDVGFQKEFDDPKDSLINRIIKFCKSLSYIKLANNIEADYFFK